MRNNSEKFDISRELIQRS